MQVYKSGSCFFLSSSPFLLQEVTSRSICYKKLPHRNNRKDTEEVEGEMMLVVNAEKTEGTMFICPSEEAGLPTPSKMKFFFKA